MPIEFTNKTKMLMVLPSFLPQMPIRKKNGMKRPEKQSANSKISNDAKRAIVIPSSHNIKIVYSRGSFRRFCQSINVIKKKITITAAMKP